MIKWLLAALLLLSPGLFAKDEKVQSIYDFEVKTIDGNMTTLAPYKGKVMLIVNTASKCGFTPQYAGLQELYDTYEERGFVVLGFPCNQFAEQEPGTNEEIKKFCTVNFAVDFPMFAKIDVNGDNTAPLYRYLKAQQPGFLWTEGIKWNFTKFLVDRNGKVVERYAPSTKPASIAKDIEKLLDAPAEPSTAK